ncbi:hypothetical protein PCC9214_03439 [Planktothrix tepida]|uniref:SPOR domain-containing protein n=2 Tax=Planktothrix TaxID=54304 RepID=A0A1J1LSK5_9CYAN|nr:MULTISPECIES: SPOR domain-containing protein [Planktothrix]CAD5945668.1 hypothetical protein NO713_02216 [Planktothrix pseudagardhii]CAD5965068.1 hypothetical protein PCC9214_03439 [Planktothrix tepida]CUR34986.1 hypothetical protein PL9214650425 [Planktothrix tepida PCC 9214]
MQLKKVNKKHNSLSELGLSYPDFLKLMIGVTIFCLTYLMIYSLSRQSNTTNINHQNLLKFPLNYCGDQTSGGTNMWYPVYVDYSDKNLKTIKESFCCDSYLDESDNLIQVASFYNPKNANNLVKVLKSNGITSARVGTGEQKTTSRSPIRKPGCN